MTTHRPRQPQLESTDIALAQPVKCQDCGKEFATKYQAKKHFLRRHFQGEKPFACLKCNKKRFVVKEDLTMHMKSCGNVYVCKCGIRLCSLGALKRHCKYFSHEAESLDPRPDPSSVGGPAGNALALEWHEGYEGGAHPMMGGNGMHPHAMMAQREGAYFYSPAAAMGSPACFGAMGNAEIGGHMEAAMAASYGSLQPGGHASAELLQLQGDGASSSMQPMGAQGWTPERLQEMLPSLAHALRAAQAEGTIDLAAAMYAAQQHASTIGASPEALTALQRPQPADAMFMGMEASLNLEQLQAAARCSQAGEAHDAKRRKFPDVG